MRSSAAPRRPFAPAAALACAVVALTALTALAACKAKDSARPAPAAGTERGACYGNGTCNDGLVCLSELCVRPPGADCAAVATKLASMMLGNYAPRDERDAYLADTRAACEAAHLTKEDGACLLDAPHRNALGRCPHLVGVGDCAAIVAKLQALKPAGAVDQFRATTADRLASRCKNEIPSKIFEACVLKAQTIDDLDRCAW
ncbi:MAG: hypothetical protein H6708_15480 [Kofleriaceae bacterium]|nr:hypothetical protein [Kofleriaceae bacterium]